MVDTVFEWRAVCRKHWAYCHVEAQVLVNSKY